MSPAEMQARIAELEAQNKDLRDRFAEVDTLKNAALNCVKEATGAVMRLAPLEAEAKQAREDEAWGIANDADVMSGHGEWTAQYWVDPLTGWISATAPTIHAALRALRVKVEGGTR